MNNILFDLLKGLVLNISTNGTEVWLETPAGGQRVGLGFLNGMREGIGRNGGKLGARTLSLLSLLTAHTLCLELNILFRFS